MLHIGLKDTRVSPNDKLSLMLRKPKALAQGLLALQVPGVPDIQLSQVYDHHTKTGGNINQIRINAFQPVQ